MKKLIFALCLLCIFGTVSAETTVYDLGKALEAVNVSENQHPEHLPGAGVAANKSSEQLKKSKLMGQPFIITWYLQKIITALTGLAAAIAVLFIIQNSFNLLTSAGGSEVVTKSKKGLMWSLIGLVVIMVSYVIVKTVISIPYAGDDPNAQSVMGTTMKPMESQSVELQTQGPRDDLMLLRENSIPVNNVPVTPPSLELAPMPSESPTTTENNNTSNFPPLETGLIPPPL